MNCEECYWKFNNYENYCAYYNDEPKKCDYFNFKCCDCDSECASYTYKEKRYCSECLINELGVQSYSVTHYELNGEYLGSDDDIDEVIDNLKCDFEIKELEDN